ncbi:hypothetical protein [Stutzerimonas stutzeri]|uniref:Uncharacterized protein n=1 Tax=Stutzerimonas stutzeri TaxID=316 RepID=A0A6I6LX24_STUST|nr:hypothetical protein [Stutzerimonas stutzeri]QGZ31152.1 hypothetical protein GQA94_14180 [Stutzerimonas stutzeri]
MRAIEKAVAECESVLRADLTYNKEHGIWPSTNRVIERMLGMRNDLGKAYQDLYEQLHSHHRALESFFDMLVFLPVGWSPEKAIKARKDRDELISVNSQIASLATQLGGLLSRRSDIQETSGFSSETHYHVLDVLKDAAEHNHHFSLYVEDDLVGLHNQYDLKYWPTLSDFAEALAADARDAMVVADNSVTAAATESRKPGLTDFLRAYYSKLDEHSIERGGLIPNTFRLSDAAIASLLSCVLDLSPDKLMSAESVKRFRQGERSKKSVATRLPLGWNNHFGKN